jgi:F-type H+-transporting ATPase subunit c
MKNKLMGLATFVTTLLVSATAFAQDAATNDSDVKMAAAFAAGIGIAIAALGGALGQGRAAAAALDGIARNPNASDKMFTPMILGLALIESLVIYSLLISYLLQSYATG